MPLRCFDHSRAAVDELEVNEQGFPTFTCLCPELMKIEDI